MAESVVGRRTQRRSAHGRRARRDIFAGANYAPKPGSYNGRRNPDPPVNNSKTPKNIWHFIVWIAIGTAWAGAVYALTIGSLR